MCMGVHGVFNGPPLRLTSPVDLNSAPTSEMSRCPTPFRDFAPPSKKHPKHVGPVSFPEAGPIPIPILVMGFSWEWCPGVYGNAGPTCLGVPGIFPWLVGRPVGTACFLPATMVMCLTFPDGTTVLMLNGWMGEEKFLTVKEHGHLEHALIRKEGDLPPRKPTCPLQINGWKLENLFSYWKHFLLWEYVNFWGCTSRGFMVMMRFFISRRYEVTILGSDRCQGCHFPGTKNPRHRIPICLVRQPRKAVQISWT